MKAFLLLFATFTISSLAYASYECRGDDKLISSSEESKKETCTYTGFCMGFGNSGFDWMTGEYDWGLDPSPKFATNCHGEIETRTQVSRCEDSDGFEYEMEDEISKSSCQ